MQRETSSLSFLLGLPGPCFPAIIDSPLGIICQISSPFSVALIMELHQRTKVTTTTYILPSLHFRIWTRAASWCDRHTFNPRKGGSCRLISVTLRPAWSTGSSRPDRLHSVTLSQKPQAPNKNQPTKTRSINIPTFTLTDWSGPSPPSTLKPNPDSCFRRKTSRSLVFGAKENKNM